MAVIIPIIYYEYTLHRHLIPKYSWLWVLFHHMDHRPIPNISIVLINWNSYEDTSECIDSLLQNPHTNTSIIVVDNNSTDDSLERLQVEYRDEVDFVSLENNTGFPAGNNRGIEYALEEKNADYLFILNNDTIAPDGAEPLVNSLLNKYRSHNNVGVISPLITFCPDREIVWFSKGEINSFTGKITHKYMDERLESIDHEKNKNSELIPGCAMFFHRDIIQEVGLMDESYFIRISDSEFTLRVRSQGYRLLVDTSTIIHHKESASTGKFGLSYYTARNRWHLIHDSMFFYWTAKVFYFWWLLKAIVHRATLNPEYSIDTIKGAIAGLTGERGKRSND